MASNNSPDLRIVMATVVLALAAFSPAPINRSDAAPKPVQERPQSELAKEQAFNGRIAPVGRTEEDTSRAIDVKNKPSDDGLNTVASAGSTLESGRATIREATARVEDSKGRGFPAWGILLILGALAFGLLRGFRTVLDRTIPTPYR